MSYTQFPHQQYVVELDVDSITDVGSFELVTDSHLEHIVFDYYYHNVQAAAFTFQAHIYGSALAGDPLYSSSILTISPDTISSTAGLNRIGLFYADFPTIPPLKKDASYFVKVQTVGNSLTASTYFSLVLDWYNEVNNQVSTRLAGARMHILGREIK